MGTTEQPSTASDGQNVEREYTEAMQDMATIGIIEVESGRVTDKTSTDIAIRYLRARAAWLTPELRQSYLDRADALERRSK